MNIRDKINFRQPKYMLPAILYIPLALTGYFVIDLFNTEKAEIVNKDLQTTEYLNASLPDAKLKSEGIGSKYDSMLDSYGKIEDFSALANIERDNHNDEKEEYTSRYSAQELEMMEKNERLRQQLAERDAQQSISSNSSENADKAIEELNRALAKSRLQGQARFSSKFEEDKAIDADSASAISRKPVVKSKNTKSNEDEDDDIEVVKKVQTNSDYFHTISMEDREPGLIKAIIDEDVKATDGTRVRLRLLDDISVGEVFVKKGTYLYVTMSGFGSQRVKGQVKSILVDGEISKVSLSIYDMDGLEGLYVPGSAFRETAKDVSSGALSGSGTNNNTTSGSSLTQWSMHAVQNAYTKTSNAVSKAIKKKSVKLKYGTFVYLVNGKSNKNK